MGVIQLTPQVVFCNEADELIQIKPYLVSVRERFIDGNRVQYRFKPSGWGHGFDAFERISGESRRKRYDKVIDEVLNLSKQSLKEVLDSTFSRIER